MSHSIPQVSIPFYVPRSRGVLALAAAAALALGALLLLAESPSAAEASVRELPAFPEAELPPEWRWERKAVDFDHMYRPPGGPERMDWIRTGRLP